MTTLDIQNEMTSVQDAITGLEARRDEIEQQLADQFPSAPAKLTTEHSGIQAQINAAKRKLQQLTGHAAIAARAAFLETYRIRVGELHSLYQQTAELDAQIETKYAEIEALNKQRAEINTQLQTASGRRSKLLAEGLRKGISNAEFDAIRREYPPIPKYW